MFIYYTGVFKENVMFRRKVDKVLRKFLLRKVNIFPEGSVDWEKFRKTYFDNKLLLIILTL